MNTLCNSANGTFVNLDDYLTVRETPESFTGRFLFMSMFNDMSCRPEGEVVRQANVFQPAQPTPVPIRHRSGRLDIMQDGRTRPVPRRSMLILFAKNSVLQTERGDLLRQRQSKHVHLKTARVSMLNRLMKERSDLLPLLIQLKRKTALEYVLLMKPIRSTLMMKYFVKERKDPFMIMT